MSCGQKARQCNEKDDIHSIDYQTVTASKKMYNANDMPLKDSHFLFILWKQLRLLAARGPIPNAYLPNYMRPDLYIHEKQNSRTITRKTAPSTSISPTSAP